MFRHRSFITVAMDNGIMPVTASCYCYIALTQYCQVAHYLKTPLHTCNEKNHTLHLPFYELTSYNIFGYDFKHRLSWNIQHPFAIPKRLDIRCSSPVKTQDTRFGYVENGRRTICLDFGYRRSWMVRRVRANTNLRAFLAPS